MQVAVPVSEHAVCINPSSCMCRSCFLFLALGLIASSALAEDKQAPTAEEIMQMVRMSYALQNNQLTGRLRDNESGKEEPFTLSMAEKVIEFLFRNPVQTVQLDLGATPPLLRESKTGETAKVPLSKYGEKVRDFDLNYEDLSLRFLYWPNPTLMGEETLVLGEEAWKIRLTTPDAKGPYGTVDVWIHQGSGGMAKMEGFDMQGRLIRRYKVNSVQKVGESHIPKEMRIESFDPNTGKRSGMTYMNFDKPPQP